MCVSITCDSKQTEYEYLFKSVSVKWTKLAHNAEVFSSRYLLNGFRWNFMFGICGENCWKNYFFRFGRVETLSYLNSSYNVIYFNKTPRGIKIRAWLGLWISWDLFFIFWYVKWCNKIKSVHVFKITFWLSCRRRNLK